jgi:hypothetical protein
VREGCNPDFVTGEYVERLGLPSFNLAVRVLLPFADGWLESYNGERSHDSLGRRTRFYRRRFSLGILTSDCEPDRGANVAARHRLIARRMFEEVEDAAVELVVLRVFQDGQAHTWARKRYRQNLPDTRCRAVRHQNQTVGEIERLVDVVRHHDHGLAVMLPDLQQDIL